MKCQHCLRGGSQRKSIPNEYTNKILHLIDCVSNLTVGGGEVTLDMDALEYLAQCVLYNSCEVDSFYLVTNGKAIPVDKLAYWVSKMTFACTDNEMSHVAFSFDNYHTHTLTWNQREKRERNYHNLQEVLDYEYGVCSGDGESIVIKHTDENSPMRLISEGRAKDFGYRPNTKEELTEEQWGEDQISFTESELYLSCTGFLVAGCDWSYNSIDHRKDIRIAHIDDIHCQDDLIEAIRRYNKNFKEARELVES